MKAEPRVRLLMMICAVTVAVIGLLAVLRGAGGARLWFLGPTVLVLGALAPTLVGGRSAGELGLRMGQTRQSGRLFAVSGLVLLAIGLAGVALLRCMPGESALRVSIPKEKWIWWAMFQFAYVALPEELFFRGFFLSQVMRVLGTTREADSPAVEAVGVALSAGVFALSHVIVFRNAVSVLTFFPGLIFAWLFVRSKSVIGPVLLHGAANVGYALMVQRLL
ncbi:MAG: CPBP family intramembrane metalloprotease [Sedimentisphaerales bacterium]|nr:CPBP family intramembrane metalloprotease [Sedimentisphaerales bacterium]